MLQTLLLFTSICLILLILLRIPEKDGGYLNSSIFTNNRKTSKFLNNLIWILTFIFFLLNIIRVFQTLGHQTIDKVIFKNQNILIYKDFVFNLLIKNKIFIKGVIYRKLMKIEHRIMFPKSYPFSIVIAIMFNI